MQKNNPKFQRNIENFICENCNEAVSGDGYTNHCPKCLHSKHVDINPGDRAEICHGLMVPVQIVTKNSQYRIQFECKICKKEIWNKSNKNDNFEAILKIASNHKYNNEIK
jgi:hypothetical protein